MFEEILRLSKTHLDHVRILETWLIIKGDKDWQIEETLAKVVASAEGIYEAVTRMSQTEEQTPPSP